MFNPLSGSPVKATSHFQTFAFSKQLSSILAFFCLSLLLTSCQKEWFTDWLPTNPKDPDAVYTLVASDTACSDPLINGNFVAGKPLPDSTNIRIEVAVSKTGKWSLSTDTLNGFLFSGSGLFTNTGKQFIVLKASGTPAMVGNYFFSVSRDSLEWIFPVSVLTSHVEMEPVPLQSYFKATIGDISYYVEVPTIGPDNIPYGRTGGDNVSLVSFVGPGIYPVPASSGGVSLQKGILYGYAASTEADFRKFFEPGAYPFSPNKCLYFSFPGIILTWVDSDNEVWTTLKKFSDQQGSSFAITGIEDGHNNKGNYFVKVKSRFNCKLYNYTTGEMKELTDGEMVSFFIR
jgi:hypothetical protein